MAQVSKAAGKNGKIVKSSGEKKRGPATESHGAARNEPSKVVQKQRDVRAQKKKTQGR